MLEDKIQEAKKEGKNVKVDSWMAPCQNPREECDLDFAIKYATPEGKTIIEYQHTW